jgi:uncharacterized RDD family membrane protein YckC
MQLKRFQPRIAQPYPEKAHLDSASLFKRVAAIIYDSLLVGGLLFVVSFAATAMNGMEAVSGPVFQSLLLVVFVGFFTKFWVNGGQTAGMKAWRLRVETLDGRPISPFQAVVRVCCSLFSVAVFGLGYIWKVFDPEGQTWHEKLSGTRTTELAKKDDSK